MIFTSLQKLPKNGEDWGKLIVAKGFKRLPKVQKIAQSGHTACSARPTQVRGMGTLSTKITKIVKKINIFEAVQKAKVAVIIIIILDIRSSSCVAI